MSLTSSLAKAGTVLSLSQTVSTPNEEAGFFYMRRAVSSMFRLRIISFATCITFLEDDAVWP